MNYFDRLHYDQETGALTWAVRAPGVRIGELAGSVNRYGYRVINLGRRLKARLHLGGRSH